MILSDMNNYLFKRLNSSIWPVGRILAGATTQGQSGPGSKSNEGVLHIPQSFRTGYSPSDNV